MNEKSKNLKEIIKENSKKASIELLMSDIRHSEFRKRKIDVMKKHRQSDKGSN